VDVESLVDYRRSLADFLRMAGAGRGEPDVGAGI
jgi:hypothetical protein